VPPEGLECSEKVEKRFLGCEEDGGFDEVTSGIRVDLGDEFEGCC
jgi:hypothetical protein